MAQMVEVGNKPPVNREAFAEGFLYLSANTLGAIRAGQIKKGDPMQVAKVAAIQAVKDTPRFLPLCHPIPITGVDVDIELQDERVRLACRVSCHYKTGVEMEALTAVAAGLLCIWDMTKYLEKDAQGQYPDTQIRNIRVIRKIKGDHQKREE